MANCWSVLYWPDLGDKLDLFSILYDMLRIFIFIISKNSIFLSLMGHDLSIELLIISVIWWNLLQIYNKIGRIYKSIICNIRVQYKKKLVLVILVVMVPYKFKIWSKNNWLTILNITYFHVQQSIFYRSVKNR